MKKRVRTMYHCSAERIPQRFLLRGFWKMTLRIENVRESVISDNTYASLLELLKFRHFKRYYFQMNWDWDKIEFLQKKLRQVHPVLLDELKVFVVFLKKL